MKIVIVSAHFPGIFGGVSDYSLNLSRTLADMGSEITVITSDNDKVITNQHKNVEVLPIVSKWDIKNIYTVFKTIKSYKPDCVYLQYVPYMYSTIGVPSSLMILAFVLWLNKIKLITTFHEVARKINYTNPKYFLVSVSQRIIAYLICVFSINVVVSLERYIDMLFMFKSKITRIPIGSSILPVNVSENEKNKLRNEIASKKEFVITTFGSSSRRIDILICVIYKLINQGSSIKFLILGKFTDELTDKFNNLIKKFKLEKVVYLKGYLESDYIYKYLFISDLFVMIEGLDDYGYVGVNTKSSALAASYAAGLPIIGVKGHMTDGFFKHKENIYFIDSKCESIIADEMKAVIGNIQLLDDLKQGSEYTYKNHLCWEVIANKYTTLLNYQ